MFYQLELGVHHMLGGRAKSKLWTSLLCSKEGQSKGNCTRRQKLSFSFTFQFTVEILI